MCRIGQPERCKQTGCEFSKAFYVHCHGEKIKTIQTPTLSDLWNKASFDKVYNLSKDQELFPLPKLKKKQLGLTPKKPVPPPIPKRQQIYNRSNGICYLCGEPVSFHEMSVDHVFPKSKGGGNNISNLRATHKKCNSDKSDKIIDIVKFTKIVNKM